MRNEIVLIGPMRSGKSTVGRLLAAELGIPQRSIDATGWQYYKDAGFDLDTARRLRDTQGELCSYQYLERYLLPALERHLNESRNCVIDVGAGHTVYTDDDAFERVQRALVPFRNVVLLLPSPDLDECSITLKARTKGIAWLERILVQSNVDMNEFFLRHHSNYDLATQTVYTNEKSPEETRDEILTRVQGIVS
ncbi:MAG: shikimate kinase [Acidobacteriota bacterium]